MVIIGIDPSPYNTWDESVLVTWSFTGGLSNIGIEPYTIDRPCTAQVAHLYARSWLVIDLLAMWPLGITAAPQSAG